MHNMKRDFTPRRKNRKLPPEKLYEILRGIYPKDIADERYKKLTGSKPPEEG